MLLAVTFALSLTPSEVAACPSTSVQVATPARPEIPEGDTFPGKRVVLVKVRVSAAGHVLGTSVLKSSGDAALDHAAVVAAESSTYQPAMRHCKGVADTFVFRTEFAGNP